jgi:hypothetical protein
VALPNTSMFGTDPVPNPGLICLKKKRGFKDKNHRTIYASFKLISKNTVVSKILIFPFRDI